MAPEEWTGGSPRFSAAPRAALAAIGTAQETRHDEQALVFRARMRERAGTACGPEVLAVVAPMRSARFACLGVRQGSSELLHGVLQIAWTGWRSGPSCMPLT